MSYQLVQFTLLGLCLLLLLAILTLVVVFAVIIWPRRHGAPRPVQSRDTDLTGVAYVCFVAVSIACVPYTFLGLLAGTERLKPYEAEGYALLLLPIGLSLYLAPFGLIFSVVSWFQGRRDWGLIILSLCLILLIMYWFIGSYLPAPWNQVAHNVTIIPVLLFAGLSLSLSTWALVSRLNLQKR